MIAITKFVFARYRNKGLLVEGELSREGETRYFLISSHASSHSLVLVILFIASFNALKKVRHFYTNFNMNSPKVAIQPLDISQHLSGVMLRSAQIFQHLFPFL